MATLTCKQPRHASLISLPNAPVSRIKAIDGEKLPPLFVSAQQSIKVIAGTRAVTTIATAGPYRSEGSFSMVFKDGETYFLETLADHSMRHRYEVKDSKGKIIASSQASSQYMVAPTTIIYVPAG